MRTIKFRYLVKRKNGHVFKQEFELSQIERGDVKLWINANRISGEDILKLQFTGLHDKNGKEIWEGDIVSRNGQPDLQEIIYDAPTFKMRDYHYDFWDDTNSSQDSIEVLGNIYSNPELLNSTDLGRDGK